MRRIRDLGQKNLNGSKGNFNVAFEISKCYVCISSRTAAHYAGIGPKYLRRRITCWALYSCGGLLIHESACSAV